MYIYTHTHRYMYGFPDGLAVKNPLANSRATSSSWVRKIHPLEKEMAAYSSILV